jgi:hypothetical protein
VRRRELSGFRKFIDADHFSITLITAFPEKAAGLRDALPRYLREPHSREPWHHRVEVVPGFAPLLITGSQT